MSKTPRQIPSVPTKGMTSGGHTYNHRLREYRVLKVDVNTFLWETLDTETWCGGSTTSFHKARESAMTAIDSLDLIFLKPPAHEIATRDIPDEVE